MESSETNPTLEPTNRYNTEQLEIWGKAQRESARRPKTD